MLPVFLNDLEADLTAVPQRTDRCSTSLTAWGQSVHCCSLQIYCPAWTKTGVRCSLWFAAILYSGLTQDPSVPRNTSTVSIVGLQQVMSRSPFIRPLLGTGLLLTLLQDSPWYLLKVQSQKCEFFTSCFTEADPWSFTGIIPPYLKG